MRSEIFVGFILFLISVPISDAKADIIYLKNGRNIEGLIKKEANESVELDIGFGTVKFSRGEIVSIDRSSPEKARLIREEWQRQKEFEEGKRSKRRKELKGLEERKRKKELEPKEIEFSMSSGQTIVINALLNKEVRAQLVLDTGASYVVLSERMAKKLNIRTNKTKENFVKVRVGDGRLIDGVYTLLDSVKVDGVEVKEVEAMVLLDTEADIEDGVLGMSFLNRFNFQIDTINKKLILQRPEIK